MLRLKYLITACVLVLTAGTANATSFFDGTFNNADWTESAFTSSLGGLSSATQQSSGGNLGAYFQVSNSVNSNGSSDAFYGSTTSLYDPSTLGAITTINYSVDQKLFGGSVGDAEIALKQNGKVYFGFPEVNQFNGSWTTFTLTGLNSSSFALLTSSINSSGELIFDSAQNPDFSSSGAPILFGLGTTFNTLSNPFSGQWGVDNWTVTVNPTPLPAALPLFATGLGALGLLGWRRKRKGAALAAA